MGRTSSVNDAVRPSRIPRSPPKIRPKTTFKGLLAGVLIGWFARKVNSLPLGIAFGRAVGLLLAYGVAAMPSETGKHYYFEIMLPGAIVGAIVGYATQKQSGPAAQPART